MNKVCSLAEKDTVGTIWGYMNMDFIVHNNIVINAKFSEFADCMVIIQKNEIHAKVFEVKCHDACT